MPIRESLTVGIRYLRGQQILLGAMTLDLFSVLFGGAVALLPVFVVDILHTGVWGLGLLRAAPAVGALGDVALSGVAPAAAARRPRAVLRRRGVRCLHHRLRPGADASGSRSPACC